ncbi:MAG: hypothetical protein JKY94_17485 [Rhodobacteraceae bacterium]|nr:hypothetical protein [Paracoccaceae bacterium]
MAARGKNAKWISKVQLAIAKALLPAVKRRIKSTTLKAYIQAYERGQDNKAVLGVPHYWAVFYHDGTGSFGPKSANYLVFFSDALSNDPRLGGSYPVRFSEWRPLEKKEFERGLEINRSMGFPFSGPYMTVTKFAGPRKGDPFFEGLHPTLVARKVVPAAFSALVKETLGKSFKPKPSKAKAKLRI